MSDPVRRALLEHYGAHARDLPWRRTSDPYRIWVSEVMLQQTQVSTVEPRYVQFLERYPTVQALARASEGEVCEAWAGLGYYRRARHLHAAAQKVVAEHAGRLPQTVQALRELPGIGRYSAGAIASIAFGAQAAIVDGNVARVLSRLHALAGQSASAPVKAKLWHLAEDLVRGERPGDLNQALMDLGATICTPTAPDCMACPARRWCRGYQQGNPTRFPAAASAVAKKPMMVAYAWVQRRGRGLWLRRRPLDGLWAGLWEPPMCTGRSAKGLLAEQLGTSLGRPVATVRHELTHLSVTARVYLPQAAPGMRKTASLQWVADPMGAALSALAKKAISAANRALSGGIAKMAK